MNIGDQVLFGGEVVVIRSVHNHVVTGQVRYLVEHSDGSFSKVGAESLAAPEPEPKPAPRPLGSIVSFLRQPAKLKRVLK